MRDVIVEDDAGLPFWVTVLDDGLRVDRTLHRIAPDKARANPVPDHFKERGPNVLVEGELTPDELTSLLDAAVAAWDALPPRKRVARFEWQGRKYRATSTIFRLQVATGDNRRFIAYRWHD